MRNASLLSILLASILVSSAVAAAPVGPHDLLGWATLILGTIRAREASFDSLEVEAVVTGSAPNEHARIDITTSGKLYRFGEVLALADGASNSSRTRDRKWAITLPVQLAAPTLPGGLLNDAPGLTGALSRVQEYLAGQKDLRLNQLQLHQAKAFRDLPGIEAVPLSITLLCPHEERALEAMRILVAHFATFALKSIRLTPVGEQVLATFTANLLTRPAALRGTAPGRSAAEAAVKQALELGGSPPEVWQVDALPTSVRIHFEAPSRGLAESWATLSKLIALQGLGSFEILEIRQDARGQARSSGLLYF